MNDKAHTANIAFINCSECFFAHSRSSEMLLTLSATLNQHYALHYESEL